MRHSRSILLAGFLLTLILACPAIGEDSAEPPDVAAVARGNNDFAFDLYAKLRGREGNLFYSPYSISDALAMTSLGARGQTAAQMAKVLHFPAEGERLYSAFGSLIKTLQGSGRDRNYELHTADALWAQKGSEFRPEFLKGTEHYFHAGVKEVNFKEATEEARKTINDWVEKATHERIKNLLQSGVLRADTRLVLTNAIYFKAGWSMGFPKSATGRAPFSVTSDKKVNVPLMHVTENLAYLDAPTFQALELPYRGRELSMVVFLPKKAGGISEFEESLTDANVNTWLGKLKTHRVEVSLPKFEFTAEFALAKTLASMGMTSAFSAGADFSGMSDKESLMLSDVIHKAFVSVDENGTEAAAATAVIARPTAIENHPSAVFRADRPFVFLIREKQTGSILFLGRLANP